MVHIVSGSYLPCQTCHAKINCGDCEKLLEEALMRVQGVNSASVQMTLKQVQIDSSLDIEMLEEILEAVGIFLQ